MMSTARCDRRAAIAACGAFALVTAMGSGAALAQSRVAVGAIRVDVAPLRANAGDPTATWVEQELPRQLAEALSGRLTPRGATLTVRIDSLTLGPNKDSRAWDNISGVVTVGGCRSGPCGRRRDIGPRRSIRRRSRNPIMPVFRRRRRRWRSGSREIFDPRRNRFDACLDVLGMSGPPLRRHSKGVIARSEADSWTIFSVGLSGRR